MVEASGVQVELADGATRGLHFQAHCSVMDPRGISLPQPALGAWSSSWVFRPVHGDLALKMPGNPMGLGFRGLGIRVEITLNPKP